jgi:hypothetical protein
MREFENCDGNFWLAPGASKEPWTVMVMSTYASEKLKSFRIRHPAHLAILEENGFTWDQLRVGFRKGFETLYPEDLDELALDELRELISHN